MRAFVSLQRTHPRPSSAFRVSARRESVPGRTFSSATTRTAIARDDLRLGNATPTRASPITRSTTHTTNLSRARDPSFDSFMIQRSMGIDDDRVASAPSHRSHAPRGARARRGRSHARDRGRKRERVHDERANECARGNEGHKKRADVSMHSFDPFDAIARRATTEREANARDGIERVDPATRGDARRLCATWKRSKPWSNSSRAQKIIIELEG